MQRLYAILATTIPHKEPMSALLPHNMDPWPDGYRSLADSKKPIDLVETSKHLGQTFNPMVANVRSISSPPRSSRAGGELQLQLYRYLIVSGGNPWHDLRYLWWSCYS